uniref:Uncharacterized protein n=1 Tax=Trichobilharzia regenti TaxID=157069 RepID=A0AA85K7Q7_TRIRE|nr:unnamed protein product [Trichobilharzia regenti]
MWKAFRVRAKVICAQSEIGRPYLHEVVFCFNEASSLVDCPPEYASDLQSFQPDLDVEDEESLMQQMESQILCPAKFIIPDYQIVEDNARLSNFLPLLPDELD